MSSGGKIINQLSSDDFLDRIRRLGMWGDKAPGRRECRAGGRGGAMGGAVGAIPKSKPFGVTGSLREESFEAVWFRGGNGRHEPSVAGKHTEGTQRDRNRTAPDPHSMIGGENRDVLDVTPIRNMD